MFFIMLTSQTMNMMNIRIAVNVTTNRSDWTTNLFPTIFLIVRGRGSSIRRWTGRRLIASSCWFACCTTTRHFDC